MRRLSIAIAAAVLFCAAPALAQTISVPIDQSLRLALPAAAANIAVGNPGVADVTVVDERNLLITGKGYGVTNILAMDRAGRTIYERQVVVSAPGGAHVSLYRGTALQEYACEASCARATYGQAGPAATP